MDVLQMSWKWLKLFTPQKQNLKQKTVKILDFINTKIRRNENETFYPTMKGAFILSIYEKGTEFNEMYMNFMAIKLCLQLARCGDVAM